MEAEILNHMRTLTGADPSLERQWAGIEKDPLDDPFGLTPLERLAIWLYTTHNPWFERINREFWQGETSEPVQAVSSILVSALRKLPVCRDVVFRGSQRYMSYDDFIARYAVGAIVQWRGFSSAARTPDKAYRNEALFAIASRSGRSLQGYSAEDGEEEVLFGADARFIVLSLRMLGGFRVLVELAEIGGE